MQAETRHDPLIGVVLEGRYRLMNVLGRGGMGTVYLAEETRLGRRYALKVLAPELTHDRACVARFLREAQTIARLEHQNIIDIHSFGEDPSGVVFFTMELLVGEDLESRVRARAVRPYSPRDACEWAIQLARAVATVHREGLIHRDLKTQNVFLARRRDNSEIVKLLDFGIARPENGSELTRTGIAIGTPSYMSPEQIRSEPVDRRADIYSFGILLFKLLTGRAPFVGDSIQVAMQHLNAPVPPPSSLVPEAGIPPGLDAIILQATSKSAADRQSTMDEIERALVAVRESASPSDSLASAHASPEDDPQIDYLTTRSVLPPRNHPQDFAAASAAVMAPLPSPPSPKALEPTIGIALHLPVAADPSEVTAAEKNNSAETDPNFPSAGKPGLRVRLRPLHVIASGAVLAVLLALGFRHFTRYGGDVSSVGDTPLPEVAAGPVLAPSPPSQEAPALPDPLLAKPEMPPAVESADPDVPPSVESKARADPPESAPAHSNDKRAANTTKERSKAKAGPVDPIAKLKERARKCRAMHPGAGPIDVDYAIGSDGSVLKASTTSDTPLAKCFVEAVKQARFDPKIKIGQRISL